MDADAITITEMPSFFTIMAFDGPIWPQWYVQMLSKQGEKILSEKKWNEKWALDSLLHHISKHFSKRIIMWVLEYAVVTFTLLMMQSEVEKNVITYWTLPNGILILHGFEGIDTRHQMVCILKKKTAGHISNFMALFLKPKYRPLSP